jgi:hypothetical protein
VKTVEVTLNKTLRSSILDREAEKNLNRKETSEGQGGQNKLKKEKRIFEKKIRYVHVVGTIKHNI